MTKIPYLGVVAGIVLGGIIWGLAPKTNDAQKTEQNNSLKATADEGTRLDEKLSKKVLKLAEYVIKNTEFTPPSKEKIPTERSGDDAMPRIAIGYFDTVVIGGRRYRPMIHDGEYVDGLEMTIQEVIDKNGNIDYNLRGMHIMITDYGLDGKCNFGISNSGGSRDIKIFYNVYGEKGLEHQSDYQKLYEDALDVLINYYESKEK